MFVKGSSAAFFGGESVNAHFEEEGCATFIVLFYRPLPDSWRDFKTTTCPPFHTCSLPLRPALCPSPPVLHTRSKAGQGFNCKFKPVFVAAMGEKTDTSSMAGDSHFHLTSRSPPPAPPQPVVNSACHSAVPCCHSPAPSLSSLTGSCACVRAQ